MNRTFIRAELLPLFEAYARIMRDRAAQAGQLSFWKQDWRKHRRRGWKRRRSAGNN